MDDREVFYVKRGGRYRPVRTYDSKFMDAFPFGSTLVTVHKDKNSNSTVRTYCVNPDLAPLIAAGIKAKETIAGSIIKHSDLRSSKKLLTQEQKTAWENLAKAFGSDIHYLEWPSAKEIADNVVNELIAEAEELLKNPSIRAAYENFLLIAELSK